jgi:dienelactone hydrolase
VRRRLLPLLLLCTACAPLGVATRLPLCAGALQAYQLLPASPPGPRPVLVLLHGASGTPASVLEPWRALAEREGVVLLAPQLPRRRAFEAAAPRVLRCVVEDAARTASLDPRRVYLFGYSMGGYLAVHSALAGGSPFAAAALFAPAVREEDRAALDLSGRKVPFALYASASDQVIPVEEVRQTRDLLASHGFPLRYRELEGQGHAYAPVAELVNADAWAFLSAQALPGP